MEMFLNIGGGVLGAVLLYYGAEYLVRGSVQLAQRSKLPALVIGLTVVAFGTSAPELVVSIDAALRNSGDISIGNVVGSNICNIALILGLSSLITPITINPALFKTDVPVLLLATALCSIFCFISGGITRIEAAILFATLIGYLYFRFRQSRGQNDAAREAEAELAEAAGKPLSLPVAILVTAAGIITLVIGARLFVGGAVYTARLMKVSEAVIGLTVVALGTSLPELATSLVAAFKGESDIAIGNVVGSNIFNILCILGIAPLISPIHAPNIAWVDIGIMIFCTAALVPVMKTGKKMSRWEGAFFFAVYLGYMAYLAFFNK